MAELFSVQAPLMIRHPDGQEEVIAELFPHPEGVVMFRTGWHLGQPEETIRVIRGELKGDGPWKVGDCVINVLGCHGTNSQLAMDYEHWQTVVQDPASDYPPPGLIAAIARRFGAITGEGAS